MTEIIMEGRNVDDAVDKACLELGIDRENANVEIIDMPKKGFLGIGNSLAKVKVSLFQIDEPKVKPAPKAQPIKKQEPVKNITPPVNKAPKPFEKKQEPIQIEVKKANFVSQTYQNVDEPISEEEKPIVELAIAHLTDILKNFSIPDFTITSKKRNGSILLDIKGEDLNCIIGHHGDTLDALQLLVSLTANCGSTPFVRIMLDTANYREKRSSNLSAYATRIAREVVSAGKRTTLEPMNPYERRIVHSAVSLVNGAVSSSIGEEPYRKIVISSVSGTPTQSVHKGFRPNTNTPRPPMENRSNFRDNREKPAPFVPGKSDKYVPPKEASDIPLYTVINKDEE